MASAVSPPQPRRVWTPPTLTSCAIPSANRAPAASGSKGFPSTATSRTSCAGPFAIGPHTPSGAAVTVTMPAAASRSTWAMVIGSCEPIASRTGGASLGTGIAQAPAASLRATAAASPAAPTSSTGGPSKACSRAASKSVSLAVSGISSVSPLAASTAATSIGVATPAPANWPSTTLRPCAGIAGATRARARPARAPKTATSLATWPFKRESTFLNTISGRTPTASSAATTAARAAAALPSREAVLTLRTSGRSAERSRHVAGATCHDAALGRTRQRHGTVERPGEVIGDDQDTHGPIRICFLPSLPVKMSIVNGENARPSDA